MNKTETVKVKCTIHHWSTNATEKLPHEVEFWKKPYELLFPDDELAKAETTKLE